MNLLNVFSEDWVLLFSPYNFLRLCDCTLRWRSTARRMKRFDFGAKHAAVLVTYCLIICSGSVPAKQDRETKSITATVYEYSNRIVSSFCTTYHFVPSCLGVSTPQFLTFSVRDFRNRIRYE